MFSLVSKVVSFIYDALVTYAASDEGSAKLVAILDEVEADGIDIPFYEPSQGQQGDVGQQGDIGSTNPQPSEGIDRAAAFVARHPEMFGGQKS